MEPTVTASQTGGDTPSKSRDLGKSTKRSMRRAELLGNHIHTAGGVKVYIVQRDRKFIARGRFQGQMFGETLGEEIERANVRLRQLLVDLDNGTFQRRSDSQNSQIVRGPVPKFTLRDLVDEFLRDKRQQCGIDTSGTYRSRLSPILEFAEIGNSPKRWRLATDIDRAFVLELKAFLLTRQVTRNGRCGGTPKCMSASQIVNCLETLRNMFDWALKPQVRKLPAGFVSPVTTDLIGQPPAKDPLRKNPMTAEVRRKLCSFMDQWELFNLSILLVLPVRPEDVIGALISDIDWDRCIWRIGTRLGGSDFTKGRITIEMPIAPELMNLLRRCRGDRTEGPLFRSRTSWKAGELARQRVTSHVEFKRMFDSRLTNCGPGKIQSLNDRKKELRRLLGSLGGVSENVIGKTFRKLYSAAGVPDSVRPYDLRGAITGEMRKAGIRHLELRYLTEHRVDDIINAYDGVDPEGEMAKYYQKSRPMLAAIAERANELEAREAAA